MTARRPLALLSALLFAVPLGCSKEYQRAEYIGTRNVDKLRLSETDRGPAAGVDDPRLRGHYLLFGPMPRALAVTRDGTTYAAWPRVRQRLDAAVGIVARDGRVRPVPNRRWQQFNPAVPGERPAALHWVSPVALFADERDRLWVLDDGRINESRRVPGGAKLVCYDLGERRVVNNIPLDAALTDESRLADVQVELDHGSEGVAYVADAALGDAAGLVVVDVATGEAWRKLDGHPSVVGRRGFAFSVEGELVYPGARGGFRGDRVPANAPGVGVESVALSPGGRDLYFTALSGETLYRVPTSYLRERPAEGEGTEVEEVDEQAPVVALGGRGALGFANESLATDSQGRVYLADAENNAVRRLTPGREEAGSRLSLDLIAQDRRLIWPTSLGVSRGTLYVLSAQENRRPTLNGGRDGRQPPYSVFRLPVGSEALRSSQ